MIKQDNYSAYYQAKDPRGINIKTVSEDSSTAQEVLIDVSLQKKKFC